MKNEKELIVIRREDLKINIKKIYDNGLKNATDSKLSFKIKRKKISVFKKKKYQKLKQVYLNNNLTEEDFKKSFTQTLQFVHYISFYWNDKLIKKIERETECRHNKYATRKMRRRIILARDTNYRCDISNDSNTIHYQCGYTYYPCNLETPVTDTLQYFNRTYLFGILIRSKNIKIISPNENVSITEMIKMMEEENKGNNESVF